MWQRWGCWSRFWGRYGKIGKEITLVLQVSRKIQAGWLHWFENVMRRNEEYIGKRMNSLVIEGWRNRGRPKIIWKDCIVEDLREKELNENDT